MAKDSLKNPHNSWVGALYLALTAVLLPWTIYLGLTLPRHHLSNHWDISWTGLDIGLIITLLLTAIFAYRKAVWLVMSATSAGSLLLVDAWFDVMSERQALQFYQALILAIFIEIPLAILCYVVAINTLKDKQ
jgi:uncharacterized membrane protein